MVFLQNVWTSLSWRTVSWSSTPGSAPTPTTPVSAASAVPGINRATTGLDDRSDAAENRFLKQWIQGYEEAMFHPHTSFILTETVDVELILWHHSQSGEWFNSDKMNWTKYWHFLIFSMVDTVHCKDLSLLNLLSQLEISIYKTLWLLTWPLTRGRHSGVPHSDLVVFTLDPLPDTVQPLQPRHKSYQTLIDIELILIWLTPPHSPWGLRPTLGTTALSQQALVF